ncbi:MAG: CopL family metal-binding regulatory protein [Gammaproteobacteria bacterium]|nr:CopL family metal-binding regulatory protein [Gammaproteobacteria bacterium]
MRRHNRCLQVVLVLALVVQGGLAGLHFATTANAALATDAPAANAAIAAAADEHDCHGHAPSTAGPANAAAPPPAAPCEHGECALCLCALPQPASMTTQVWLPASLLQAELRTHLSKARHVHPPDPLLRPPIA